MTHPEDDRELLRRAREGDRAARGELFTRYWRAARAVAWSVTGELPAAEDAAAEGLEEALAGLAGLRDPARFGSWLRTIVRRKARRGRRLAAEAPGELPDRAERPDEAMLRREAEMLLREAVEALPGRVRAAMTLLYFEGYDAAAAARFLRIPPGTLRRRLYEGRAGVRRRIERVLAGGALGDSGRAERIREIGARMERGDLYGAVREMLALPRPPAPLIERLGPAPGWGRELLRPSARAQDLGHPVGRAAAAIRAAVPEVTRWPEGRPWGTWPPGAYWRATRALVHCATPGRARSLGELLGECPDPEAFRAAAGGLRLSDALDLVWISAGGLELKGVEESLARVAAAVLPGEPVRFSACQEPRYRAGLVLWIGAEPRRGACGGVLARGPAGGAAAQVRIFLEPWATVQSAEAVDFDPLPAGPGFV